MPKIKLVLSGVFQRLTAQSRRSKREQDCLSADLKEIGGPNSPSQAMLQIMLRGGAPLFETPLKPILTHGGGAIGKQHLRAPAS
jgi:hypothetical protein